MVRIGFLHVQPLHINTIHDATPVSKPNMPNSKPIVPQPPSQSSINCLGNIARPLMLKLTSKLNLGQLWTASSILLQKSITCTPTQNQPLCRNVEVFFVQQTTIDAIQPISKNSQQPRAFLRLELVSTPVRYMCADAHRAPHTYLLS